MSFKPRKNVSRCPAIPMFPGAPGRAVPSMCPTPTCRVRDVVPSRTSTANPSLGISMRPRTSPSFATIRDELARAPCASAYICLIQRIAGYFLVEPCMQKHKHNIGNVTPPTRKRDLSVQRRSARLRVASDCCLFVVFIVVWPLLESMEPLEALNTPLGYGLTSVRGRVSLPPPRSSDTSHPEMESWGYKSVCTDF